EYDSKPVFPESAPDARPRRRQELTAASDERVRHGKMEPALCYRFVVGRAQGRDVAAELASRLDRPSRRRDSAATAAATPPPQPPPALRCDSSRWRTSENSELSPPDFWIGGAGAFPCSS